MPEDVIVLGGRRYYDPVTCLLLFAAAVKGGAPSELMLELGVDDARIEEIFSSSEQDLAALSQLAALSELLDREMLGRLLRVKLAELLLTARKGTELSALTRAAAKLPPWAFGEAEVEALPQRAAGSARTATKAGAGDVCPACGQPPEDDMSIEEAMAETRLLLTELERTGKIDAELRRIGAIKPGQIEALVVPPPVGAAAGDGCPPDTG